MINQKSRFSVKRLTLLAAVTAIAAHMADARAIGLGLFYAEVKVKTESEIIAGLDEPTRRLLLSMPATVRTEMVELIRQSLPLLEQSTSVLIEKIDKAVEGRINQLVCTGQAMGIGVAEEFKAGLLGTDRPKPVKELVDVWDARSKEFKSVSARSIAIDYEDLLHQAGITACRLADASPAQRISDLRTEARQKWRVWMEIEKTCAVPADCLGKRYEEVQALVAKADPRDVNQAQSKAALANVKLVEPQGGVWAWFRSAIGSPRWAGVDATWIAHETELEKLRNVQRALEATTAMRVSTAKRYLTDGISGVLAAEEGVLKAKALLSPTDPAANDKAAATVQAAMNGKTAIVAQIDLAALGDSSLLTDVDAAKKRLIAIEEDAAKVLRDADAYKKAIAVAAAAAARAKAERDAARAERAAERDARLPR